MLTLDEELPISAGSSISTNRSGGQCPPYARTRTSDVEEEVQHVAVLDDVFLAFLAQPPSRGGAGFALVLDEVVVADRLGADEAFLEIAVDHPCRLRCGGTALQLPSAHFLQIVRASCRERVCRYG